MKFLSLAILLAAALAHTAPAHAESQAATDVRILSADDMAGRAMGTPGSAKARTYILQRIKALGLNPAQGAFEQPFTYQADGKTHAGTNIVARIDGTGASDRVLVVSAHYDHLGVHGGQVFNGADDNASGVAGLLAVAAAFKAKPPKHTVIFAIVDGEELDLRGSKAFVDRPPVLLSKIALDINFGMLSRSDKNELWVSGAHHFPALRSRLETLAKTAPVNLKLGHDGPPWTGDDDWTLQSDHGAFHEKGVPWVYFGVEDHADYHQPTDDFAAIPQEFFDRVIGTVVAAARMFDDDLDAVATATGR